MSSNEDKRPDCVVTGYYNGVFRSVLLRGEKNRLHAQDYGTRKGWSFIRVIQAVAVAAGVFAGVSADRAVAQTAEQREVIARIAVDTVGVLKCGVPQKPDMFDGIERTGMRPDDVVNPDGKFAYVTTAVLSHAFAHYNDHPAQFCAFIVGTRVR